jgi:hypothetical protein
MKLKIDIRHIPIMTSTKIRLIDFAALYVVCVGIKTVSNLFVIDRAMNSLTYLVQDVKKNS